MKSDHVINTVPAKHLQRVGSPVFKDAASLYNPERAVHVIAAFTHSQPGGSCSHKRSLVSYISMERYLAALNTGCLLLMIYRHRQNRSRTDGDD